MMLESVLAGLMVGSLVSAGNWKKTIVNGVPRKEGTTAAYISKVQLT